MNVMEWFQQSLPILSLTTPRLIIIFMVIPIFGPELIPAMPRNGIALAFALFLFPLVSSQVPADVTPLFTVGIILKECLLGLLLGGAMGFAFWVPESIGTLIDMQRGSGMAQMFDPSIGQETTPMGKFLLNLMGAVFFASGGFVLFLSTVLTSYKVWPVYSFLPVVDSNMVSIVAMAGAKFMSAVVLYSAPVIAAMFLLTVGLGMINRFSPKLNVFVISMPLNSLLGVIVLTLYLSGFIDLMHNFIMDFDHLFYLIDKTIRPV